MKRREAKLMAIKDMREANQMLVVGLMAEKQKYIDGLNALGYDLPYAYPKPVFPPNIIGG